MFIKSDARSEEKCSDSRKVVKKTQTLGLVLCCSLLSSLSLCSLSYSSRISAVVRFLSTTYTVLLP